MRVILERCLACEADPLRVAAKDSGVAEAQSELIPARFCKDDLSVISTPKVGLASEAALHKKPNLSSVISSGA
jgi:hypothetical protein